MENIIIELSQEQSENVRGDGDWVSNLSDKNILINEGDELSVNSIFLDTVSSTDGKVKIPEELTLTVGVVQYMTSWRSNSDFVYDPAGSPIPNSHNYFKSRFKTLPTPGTGFSGYFTLNSVEFEYDGSGGENFGGFSAHFTYIDIHGVHQNTFLKVPEENKDRTNSVTVPSGIVFEENSLIWVNIKEGKSFATETGTIKKTPISEGETVFSLEIENFVMTLPAGDYDPAQLATFLSTQMSVNKQIGVSDTNFVKSAFMSSSEEIDTNQLFVRFDGSQTLEILKSGDPSSSSAKYWSGANQIQWKYDENTKLFSLDFFHFPILDEEKGTEISARYFYESNNPASDILTATTNSGCVIQSLTAQTADGTYTNFWGNTLGFDVADMAPTVTTLETSDLANFQPRAFTPRLDLKVGINLVNGYVGLDSAVFKNGTSAGGTQWYQVPTTLPLESTISNTNPIFAAKSFENILLTSSHFLVELNSTFVNNFVNETTTRGNIQSIVSRYYGYEQFTSSEGAGSITYVHKGAPVYIKTIGCRILLPDLTLATIGKRNHIYLQIIKPTQTAAIQAPPKK